MNNKKFSELDSKIWFLLLNFFKESPKSYLSPDAFIEERVIYNSSYSNLCLNIEEITLCAEICDEDCSISVYNGRKGLNKGELVYLSKHFTDNSSPDKVEVYKEGKWKDKIFRKIIEHQ